MNAKTRLAVWLAGKKKNYREGVAIYKELAVNPDRNNFFSTPIPGKMHENMLNSDLRRYARIRNISPIKASEVKKRVRIEKAAFERITKKQKQKQQPLPELKPELKPDQEQVPKQEKEPEQGKVQEPEQKQEPRPDTAIEATRVRILKNPKVNYDELPVNLQKVYDRLEGLYREYDDKRVRMIELPKDASHNAERKQLAQEIVALKKTITASWEEIDSWWENRGETNKTEIVKPSGKMTKAEIETISDPEVKALSKRMRIEANMKYLVRNHGSTVAKTMKQVEERKQELDQWGVDYAETLAKNS
jgi:glutathione peroxidase-family protein